MSETMICEICGKTVKRNRSNQKYCPECAANERRRRFVIYKENQKQKQGKVPMETTLVCGWCGKTIKRNSAAQKYCPECAKLAHLQHVKDRYREEHPATEKFIVCEKCGKTVKRTASNQKYCHECARPRPTMEETMICERCGKTIKRNAANQKYCRECAQVTKHQQTKAYVRPSKPRPTTETTMVCERCGKTIKRNAPRQKYCSECSVQLDRERSKARYCRCHPVETTMICERCGKTTERHSGQQKYCPECARAMKRQHERESYIRRQQRLAEMKSQGIVPEKHKKPSPLPGSLARIAQEARAAGMTYGAYSVAVQTGTLEMLLKQKGITDWPERLAALDR